jgi:hypothetical protein
MHLFVNGPHDCGGEDGSMLALDLKEKNYEHWERAVHAAMLCLVTKKLLTVDEMRRGVGNSLDDLSVVL